MAPEFHETRMGQRFYERTVPELVRQVERLADALERGRPKPVESVPTSFEPGAQVYIESNPHHADASGIVGDVVEFKPKAGFMGCDLVEVRYQRPRDGVWHVMPFSADALNRGDRTALLARAQRLDEQADQMRTLADSLECKS